MKKKILTIVGLFILASIVMARPYNSYVQINDNIITELTSSATTYSLSVSSWTNQTINARDRRKTLYVVNMSTFNVMYSFTNYSGQGIKTKGIPLAGYSTTSSEDTLILNNYTGALYLIGMDVVGTADIRVYEIWKE